MSILDELNINEMSNAFSSRMSFLEQKNYDTELYKVPIKNLEEKLNHGVRSLVVYGEPQSGKTEFMIALVCRLIDLGYKSIFLILNDNTELEEQNYLRFKLAQQIKPSPINHTEFVNLEDYDKRSDKRRIIFCRKNKANLEKLIEHGKFLHRRVIIDDEADFASPDTKVNKDGDPSAINHLVGKLGDLGINGEGKYIGVTATPGRLDLNNTFFNQSSDWIFLEPHKAYKGRSFFFPHDLASNEDIGYNLVKLPEEQDNPKFLREAFLRYLIRCAILNLREGTSNYTSYSMLIHTDGSVLAHEEDQKQILSYFNILMDHEHAKLESFLDYMKSFAEREIQRLGETLDVLNVLRFVMNGISRHSVLVINNKNLKRNVEMSCNPKDLFTVAIGGNIVSRGLTFNNLLSFFFSRGVKGKMQQNTYIQRARMFGVREYHKYFELCVPGSLFEEWATCFADHELSLQFAKVGDYVHIHSKGNTPADSASIDKANVVQARDEWRVGEVFAIDNYLEDLFNNIDGPPLDFLNKLIDEGKLPKNAISNSILMFIRSMGFDDQKDISIITAAKGGFVDIERYKDLSDQDKANVVRKRGGLISSTINKRDEFNSKIHLLLPIKNRSGFARFYYKNYLGKRVLKNMKV